MNPNTDPEQVQALLVRHGLEPLLEVFRDKRITAMDVALMTHFELRRSLGLIDDEATQIKYLICQSHTNKEPLVFCELSAALALLTPSATGPIPAVCPQAAMEQAGLMDSGARALAMHGMEGLKLDEAAIRRFLAESERVSALEAEGASLALPVALGRQEQLKSRIELQAERLALSQKAMKKQAEKVKQLEGVWHPGKLVMKLVFKNHKRKVFQAKVALEEHRKKVQAEEEQLIALEADLKAVEVTVVNLQAKCQQLQEAQAYCSGVLAAVPGGPPGRGDARVQGLDADISALEPPLKQMRIQKVVFEQALKLLVDSRQALEKAKQMVGGAAGVASQVPPLGPVLQAPDNAQPSPPTRLLSHRNHKSLSLTYSARVLVKDLARHAQRHQAQELALAAVGMALEARALISDMPRVDSGKLRQLEACLQVQPGKYDTAATLNIRAGNVVRDALPLVKDIKGDGKVAEGWLREWLGKRINPELRAFEGHLAAKRRDLSLLRVELMRAWLAASGSMRSLQPQAKGQAAAAAADAGVGGTQRESEITAAADSTPSAAQAAAAAMPPAAASGNIAHEAAKAAADREVTLPDSRPLLEITSPASEPATASAGSAAAAALRSGQLAHDSFKSSYSHAADGAVDDAVAGISTSSKPDAAVAAAMAGAGVATAAAAADAAPASADDAATTGGSNSAVTAVTAGSSAAVSNNVPAAEAPTASADDDGIAAAASAGRPDEAAASRSDAAAEPSGTVGGDDAAPHTAAAVAAASAVNAKAAEPAGAGPPAAEEGTPEAPASGPPASRAASGPACLAAANVTDSSDAGPASAPPAAAGAPSKSAAATGSEAAGIASALSLGGMAPSSSIDTSSTPAGHAEGACTAAAAASEAAAVDAASTAFCTPLHATMRHPSEDGAVASGSPARLPSPRASGRMVIAGAGHEGQGGQEAQQQQEARPPAHELTSCMLRCATMNAVFEDDRSISAEDLPEHVRYPSGSSPAPGAGEGSPEHGQRSAGSEGVGSRLGAAARQQAEQQARAQAQAHEQAAAGTAGGGVAAAPRADAGQEQQQSEGREQIDLSVCAPGMPLHDACQQQSTPQEHSTATPQPPPKQQQQQEQQLAAGERMQWPAPAPPTPMPQTPPQHQPRHLQQSPVQQTASTTGSPGSGSTASITYVTMSPEEHPPSLEEQAHRRSSGLVILALAPEEQQQQQQHQQQQRQQQQQQVQEHKQHTQGRKEQQAQDLQPLQKEPPPQQQQQLESHGA